MSPVVGIPQFNPSILKFIESHILHNSESFENIQSILLPSACTIAVSPLSRSISFIAAIVLRLSLVFTWAVRLKWNMFMCRLVLIAMPYLYRWLQGKDFRLGGNKYVNLWGENCKYKITEFIPVTLCILYGIIEGERGYAYGRVRCLYIHMYITNTFSCCPIKQFSSCFFLFRFSVHFQSSRVY